MKLEYVLPSEIEQRSFAIIAQELGGRDIPDEIRPVVMRAIHTTADFDYADNLRFSQNAVLRRAVCHRHQYGTCGDQ